MQQFDRIGNNQSHVMIVMLCNAIVLCPKRGCDQVIDSAVEQEIQLFDKAADIP